MPSLVWHLALSIQSVSLSTNWNDASISIIASLSPGSEAVSVGFLGVVIDCFGGFKVC